MIDENKNTNGQYSEQDLAEMKKEVLRWIKSNEENQKTKKSQIIFKKKPKIETAIVKPPANKPPVLKSAESTLPKNPLQAIFKTLPTVNISQNKSAEPVKEPKKEIKKVEIKKITPPLVKAPIKAFVKIQKTEKNDNSQLNQFQIIILVSLLLIFIFLFFIVEIYFKKAFFQALITV